jgi:hypothetical protein
MTWAIKVASSMLLHLMVAFLWMELAVTVISAVPAGLLIAAVAQPMSRSFQSPFLVKPPSPKLAATPAYARCWLKKI